MQPSTRNLPATVIAPGLDQATSFDRTVVRFADGLECQCAIGGLWWANLGYEPAGDSRWTPPTPATAPPSESSQARCRSLAREMILDLVGLQDAGGALVADSRRQALNMAVRLAEHNHLAPVVIRGDALSAGTRPPPASPAQSLSRRPDDAPRATVSDETFSGFRHRGGWFVPCVDDRPVDAVIVGPGACNGRSRTWFVVVGPRLENKPDDLVRSCLEESECQAVLAIGRRFMSPRLREDSDRNARLLSRGIETLVDQRRLVPIEARPGRTTSGWDHVLRLPDDARTQHPQHRLRTLLERLRRDHVWVAGVEPDKIVIMPAITSNEADVARILDALHSAL